MRVRFKYFQGTLCSWDDLFDEATEFASQLQPERLISISHSCDKDSGVVTVWYWSEQNEETEG